MSSVALIGSVRFIISIVIGVIVYKDAKKQGLDAWLWSLTAMIVPSFIGALIYLVVSNQYARKWQCSNCKEVVLEDYNLCPKCEAVFQKTCKHCNKVMTPESTICPYCGQAVEATKNEKKAYKEKSPIKISKTIGIILIIYIISIPVCKAAIIGLPYYNQQKIESEIVQATREQTRVENSIYSESFKGKTGDESRRFRLVEGKNLGIKGNVELKSGTVKVSIKNKAGEIIYTEDFKPGTQAIEITRRVSGTEEFELIITFNKAKGEINLQTT